MRQTLAATLGAPTAATTTPATNNPNAGCSAAYNNPAPQQPFSIIKGGLLVVQPPPTPKHTPQMQPKLQLLQRTSNVTPPPPPQPRPRPPARPSPLTPLFPQPRPQPAFSPHPLHSAPYSAPFLSSPALPPGPHRYGPQQMATPPAM